MAAAVGTTSVLFRVGSGSPSKVFLGSASVLNVPEAPTWNVAYNAGSITVLEFYAPSGGPTSYNVYINGVLQPPPGAGNSAGGLVGYTYDPGFPLGAQAEVAAVNALGEGPRSAPITLTNP